MSAAHHETAGQPDHGAKVACLVMLKNERTLAPLFLRYHAALFGVENIFVLDNGSTDPEQIAELHRFAASGGHVEWSHNMAEDFQQKAELIGSIIRRLDDEADYDFYMPLDCDEFVVLRTDAGYTADPDAIRIYLGGLRGERCILRVAENLSNLLGYPDQFQAAPYSKTIWPRGMFLRMDQGYHSGEARDGTSPYLECELVYAHFHYRPYDEVIQFAKQKLSTRLSEEQLDDHVQLRNYRGMGWHIVHHIINGADGYYQQFRNVPNPVAFPGLGEQFEAFGLESPFSRFRLPPPETPSRTTTPPHLVVDDATSDRVRGWAMDREDPFKPLFLRFLIDGEPVWEGICDQSRSDVLKGGHPTEHVGFNFELPCSASGRGPRMLSVQNGSGEPERMLVKGSACYETALTEVEVMHDA